MKKWRLYAPAALRKMAEGSLQSTTAIALTSTRHLGSVARRTTWSVVEAGRWSPKYSFRMAPASSAPSIVVEKNWKKTISLNVPPTASRLFFRFFERHARLGRQVAGQRVELLGPVGVVVIGRRGGNAREIDRRPPARLDGHRVGRPDVEPVGPVHKLNLLRHSRSPSGKEVESSAHALQPRPGETSRSSPRLATRLAGR